MISTLTYISVSYLFIILGAALITLKEKYRDMWYIAENLEHAKTPTNLYEELRINQFRRIKKKGHVPAHMYLSHAGFHLINWLLHPVLCVKRIWKGQRVTPVAQQIYHRKSLVENGWEVIEEIENGERKIRYVPE